MPIVVALLLLAPEGAHEIKLRFEKGMVYEETSTRHVDLKLTEQGKILRFDTEDDYVVRRTVEEVGEDGLPAAERVEVVRFIKKINQQPDREKPGVEPNPAQGKTFAWRRKGSGYALFEGEDEVTAKHPRLVERLLNWRAGRLPEKAVAVGGSWEIPAAAFLEATGQPIPPGLEGGAVFKLEEVQEGIARISFEFKSTRTERGSVVAWVQRGTWRFDLAKGRELSLESEGSIEIDKMDRGFGTFRQRRTITYP
jgi:hypothetical protein